MSNREPLYIASLTPLRGIAALLVVVYHSDLMLSRFVPPDTTMFVRAGWIWVDFFFILSGFVMMHVYGGFFGQTISMRGYCQYMGARLARIFPLNLFTLLITLVSCGLIFAAAEGLDDFFLAILDPSAALPSALLLQGMHLYTIPPLNTPSWSLSAEWWTYALFPMLVPLLQRASSSRKATTALLVGLGYTTLMYYVAPVVAGHSKPTIRLMADFGFPRCLVGFLLGILVYELYRSGSAERILRRDTAFLLLSSGALATMHFGLHQLLTIGLFPCIILAAAYNNGRLERALATRPFQMLGNWSFSIYMVHVPIIFLFWAWFLSHEPTLFADIAALRSRPHDYGLGLARLGALVSATLVAAGLTYRYVEVPSRRYLNFRFRTKT